MTRTNKAERTAMNLTRIAMIHDTHINETMSTALYEIAHDHDVAMCDGRDAHSDIYDHLIFIPQKDLAAAREKWEHLHFHNETYFIESDIFKTLLDNWYCKAVKYNDRW